MVLNFFFKQRELRKSVVAKCDYSCSPKIKSKNVSYVENWTGGARVEIRHSREETRPQLWLLLVRAHSAWCLALSPFFFLLLSSSSLG